MAIESYNAAPVIFLVELETQCCFAEFSYERLQEAAPRWYEGVRGDELDNAMPPRDIMIYCTSFLSSTAVIAKFLFIGNRKGEQYEKTARRCARLRELLEVNDLATLLNLSVHNSFEHIDERLDNILHDFTSGTIDPLSVTEKPPSQDTIVLKRFDPRRLTISCVGGEISLGDCVSDVRKVHSRISLAYKKLDGPRFDLWSV